MTTFLVANAIRQGAPILAFAQFGQDIADDFTRQAKGVLDDCVFFDVSVAAELYWAGRKDSYDLESDFGPLRPPYPNIWMEWNVPARIHSDGQWVEEPEWNSLRFGAFVTTTVLDAPSAKSAFADPRKRETLIHRLRESGEDPDRVLAAIESAGDDAPDMVAVTVWQFCMSVNGYRPGIPQMVTTGWVIGLFTDGHFIPGTCRRLESRADAIDDPEFAAKIAKMDVNTVWMALNLINCRNVKTREGGQVFRRSGRDKRRREAGTRFHTIQLPGVVSRSAGRRTRQEEAVMAEHRVRGHFKTYTQESPLLGKYVGTWWWGWQVRGSKARGEIEADYQVGAR